MKIDPTSDAFKRFVSSFDTNVLQQKNIDIKVNLTAGTIMVHFDNLGSVPAGKRVDNILRGLRSLKDKPFKVGEPKFNETPYNWIEFRDCSEFINAMGVIGVKPIVKAVAHRKLELSNMVAEGNTISITCDSAEKAADLHLWLSRATGQNIFHTHEGEYAGQYGDKVIITAKTGKPGGILESLSRYPVAAQVAENIRIAGIHDATMSFGQPKVDSSTAAPDTRVTKRKFTRDCRIAEFGTTIDGADYELMSGGISGLLERLKGAKKDAAISPEPSTGKKKIRPEPSTDKKSGRE